MALFGQAQGACARCMRRLRCLRVAPPVPDAELEMKRVESAMNSEWFDTWTAPPLLAELCRKTLFSEVRLPPDHTQMAPPCCRAEEVVW